MFSFTFTKMHKLNKYYMIHSRSYSFLFTLTIAFIAIFDYSTNLTFKILHSYHNQCAHKTKRDSQPQHLQNQNKHCKLIHKQPLTHQR